jgi:hypothetical protein
LSVSGWVLLPVAAAFGLYLLVWMEPRYVAPFFFVLWSALFAGLSVRSQRLVLCVALAIVAANLFKIGREAMKEPSRPAHEQWQMAENLQRLGIAPGSRVAFVGLRKYSLHYWAHLGGYRIVADLDREDLAQFWSAPPAVRGEILNRLEQLDVRAVVASDCPVGAWTPLAATKYCVDLASDGTIAREQSLPGYTAVEIPEVVGAALDRKPKRE